MHIYPVLLQNKKVLFVMENAERIQEEMQKIPRRVEGAGSK